MSIRSLPISNRNKAEENYPYDFGLHYEEYIINMIRKSKLYGKNFELVEINAKITSKLFSVYHERPIAMIMYVKEAFKMGDLADLFRNTGVKAHVVGKVKDYKFGYYWDMLEQKSKSLKKKGHNTKFFFPFFAFRIFAKLFLLLNMFSSHYLLSLIARYSTYC